MYGRFFYQDSDIFCHHTLDLRPNPADFPMHAHETMELMYFISISGAYMVEGTQYDLRPGDILVLRSAEAHKLLLSPGEAYDRIAIRFSASLFSALDPEGQLLRPFLYHPLGQLNLYRQAHFASPHWQSAFKDFDMDAHDAGEVRLHILSRLFPILVELNKAYARRPDKQESTDQPLSARLVAYVNSHLFENLSLERISGAFFISKSQTNRIFSQATGSSVWKYVLIKRLLAARARIQNGEPANKVSAACGFREYSAFYRAYRARFGCAPKNDAR